MFAQKTWLTTSEVARELGVTPVRVRQLLARSQLVHVETPLGRLIDPADLERLQRDRAERQKEKVFQWQREG